MNDQSRILMKENYIHKIAKGIIADDPAIASSIGTSLHFRPVYIGNDLKDQAVWLKDWDSFEGILLSIHFSDSPNQGSAILVAPGIALCARHVIDPHVSDIMNGSTVPVCIGIAKHGLQIWQIRKITLVNESDLAILGLTYAADLPPDLQFNQAIISTRFPKIGEKLMIAGFRASDSNFEIPSNELTCGGNVIVCTGEVTERYETARDQSFLRWPTLEVNCPSWGGMSGGPVFDSTGMLIGLLSSSFTFEDSTGPSYVSLLWPALCTQFEGGWPAAYFPGKTSLMEMESRLCAIDNRSVFKVSVDPTNNSMNVQYKMWE